MDVPGAALVRAAKHGAWIAGAPAFDEKGEVARVPAGGKVLTIDLADGRLAVAP